MSPTQLVVLVVAVVLVILWLKMKKKKGASPQTEELPVSMPNELAMPSQNMDIGMEGEKPDQINQ